MRIFWVNKHPELTKSKERRKETNRRSGIIRTGISNPYRGSERVIVFSF
jgi:hypothetical protein